jgi:hypothetical protein
LILTIAPLTALLSPLALMGAMPFAAHAVASGWPTGAGIGPCLSGRRSLHDRAARTDLHGDGHDTVGAGAVPHLHATDYAGGGAELLFTYLMGLWAMRGASPFGVDAC